MEFAKLDFPPGIEVKRREAVASGGVALNEIMIREKSTQYSSNHGSSSLR
jgi:hypothetical protein